MEKSSPEKSDASPICGRALLRGRPAHFLLTAAAGILGGLLVAFFSEFSSDGLWAAAYWSSSVYGFWIFTTSLLVLRSEKRHVACVGSGLYIFFMFLVTTVYMSLRLFCRGGTPYETLFDMTQHSFPGWMWYSTPPALLCAGSPPCYGEDEKPERSARFFDGCRLSFSALKPSSCSFMYSRRAQDFFRHWPIFYVPQDILF